jgi:hypothetical protein
LTARQIGRGGIRRVLFSLAADLDRSIAESCGGLLSVAAVGFCELAGVASPLVGSWRSGAVVLLALPPGARSVYSGPQIPSAISRP